MDNKKCPICEIDLSHPFPLLCEQCGWDLKHDITLVPSLHEIPENILENYQKRAEISRRIWMERLDAVKRQKELEEEIERLRTERKAGEGQKEQERLEAVKKQKELEEKSEKLCAENKSLQAEREVDEKIKIPEKTDMPIEIYAMAIQLNSQYKNKKSEDVIILDDTKKEEFKGNIKIVDNGFRTVPYLFGEEYDVLYGHESAVTTVAFSPDGKYIFSGSMDNTIKMWIASSKSTSLLARFAGHSRYGVNTIAISPDGKFVVSGNSDNTISIWGFVKGNWLYRKKGKELKRFTDLKIAVCFVNFSPDSKYILAGGYGQVIVCDITTGKNVRVFCFEGRVYSATFSSDGKCIFVRFEDYIEKWDISSGEMKQKEMYFLWKGSPLIGAFSPNGKYFFTANYSQKYSYYSQKNSSELILYDVITDNIICIFKGHRGSINSVAFSPDGKYAVSGSDDRNMRLWDLSAVLPA